jgi:hypothetical protein
LFALFHFHLALGQQHLSTVFRTGQIQNGVTYGDKEIDWLTAELAGEWWFA